MWQRYILAPMVLHITHWPGVMLSTLSHKEGNVRTTAINGNGGKKSGNYL